MKIGFIGCGNMASAMIGGIIKNQVAVPEEILASAKSEATREKAAKNLGIRLTASNQEVAAFADVLILAVKPFYYEQVIAEIKGDVKEEAVIVSITPGKTLVWLEEQFGRPMKVVRTMPNTPALVGEGISCICGGSQVEQEDLDKVCEIFSGFGKTEIVEEPMIDVFVGVSGSSPAYVFMFIEALADAGVSEGMSRAQAYRFAAQAVLGSAKMVLETGKHPGELKDMVCSPKGTTIEAVRILEEKGLRSAVFEAAKACVIKAREV
ncbi:MAG: pyrroline-5-carboxylate reductase [Bacillota bacterium]|nr:pyrroline-5-carboxylate reductase [Bacillota bacterium]